MAKLTLEIVGNSTRNDYRPLVIPPVNRFTGRPHELCEFQKFPQVIEHHGAHFYQTTLELDSILRQVMETPTDATLRNGSRHLTPAIGIHGTDSLGIDIHDPTVFRAVLKVLYDKQRTSKEWQKSALDVPFHQFFDQIDSVKGQQISSTPCEVSKEEVLAEITQNRNAERKAALKKIVQWWAVEGVLQGIPFKKNNEEERDYTAIYQEHKWANISTGVEKQCLSDIRYRPGSYGIEEFRQSAKEQSVANQNLRGGMTEFLYGSLSISQAEFEALTQIDETALRTIERVAQKDSSVTGRETSYQEVMLAIEKTSFKTKPPCYKSLR